MSVPRVFEYKFLKSFLNQLETPFFSYSQKKKLLTFLRSQVLRFSYYEKNDMDFVYDLLTTIKKNVFKHWRDVLILVFRR